MDQNFNNQEKEETLSTPGVFDKYQTAGKIANTVLERVILKTVANADIAEVCAYGDAEINGELSKVYNKK
jgi:curved DNA binding protein